MVGMSGEQIYELFRNAPGGERLARAADIVRELMDEFHDSYRQVGSFGDARNSVVPVPPAPAQVIPWSMLLSGDTIVTYAQQKAEHDAASQHNVDVMTGYEEASVFSTDGMPTEYGAINGAPPQSTDIDRYVPPPAQAPAEPGVVLSERGSRAPVPASGGAVIMPPANGFQRNGRASGGGTRAPGGAGAERGPERIDRSGRDRNRGSRGVGPWC